MTSYLRCGRRSVSGSRQSDGRLREASRRNRGTFVLREPDGGDIDGLLIAARASASQPVIPERWRGTYRRYCDRVSEQRRALFHEKSGEAVPREVVALALLGSVGAAVLGVIIDGADFRGYDITVNVLGSIVLIGPGLFTTNLILQRWRDRRARTSSREKVGAALEQLNLLTHDALIRPVTQAIARVTKAPCAIKTDYAAATGAERARALVTMLHDLQMRLGGLKQVEWKGVVDDSNLPYMLRSWANFVPMHVEVLADELALRGLKTQLDGIRHAILDMPLTANYLTGAEERNQALDRCASLTHVQFDEYIILDRLRPILVDWVLVMASITIAVVHLEAPD